MPEVAEAALSYVLFIMGGLMIVGGFLYFLRNSYIGKESMEQATVTSKVLPKKYETHNRFGKCL